MERGSVDTMRPGIAIVGIYVQSTRDSKSEEVLRFDTSQRLVANSVRVSLVELLSIDGVPLKSMHGNQSVRIRIHYRCEGVLVSPSFTVTFSALNGVEVLRLSTLPISGFELPDLSGQGYVDCVIEHLPFTGGIYVLGVGVGRPNVEYLVFDRNIGWIEIPPYDAYGSGFGVDRRCGVLTVPHHWELKNDSEA